MDQPFVWLVRELKFSRFRGHIRALGGCILCLGCVDTAWAAISNQKGRGDSSWLAHLRVHMGEQQHLCTHWHLNTKLSTGTGGVQHLRRHMLTKQPFLISSGKALTLVLTISPSWLLWDSPLVGFLMPDLDKHILRLSSLSLIYVTFLLCFFSFVCLPWHLQVSKQKDLTGPEWHLLSWQALLCLAHLPFAFPEIPAVG